MITKVMCCFDTDVDIHNDTLILTYFANLKDLKQRIFISAGPADVLEHASYSFSYGGKILIDFTGLEIHSKFDNLFLKNNNKLYSYGKLALIKTQKNSLNLKDSYLLNKSELEEFSIIIVSDNLDFDLNDPFLLFWYIF
jgi:3-polyprenyl-4-hydroxybenzoate decarboxylase